MTLVRSNAGDPLVLTSVALLHDRAILGFEHQYKNGACFLVSAAHI